MNIEDEIIRQGILVGTGKPVYIKGDRLEIDDEDSVGPLQLPVTGMPGQTAASAALGIAGEPGAAAPIEPTNFEKMVSGLTGQAADIASSLVKQTGNLAMAVGPAAVNKALQEAINFGAEIVDAVGNKIGRDPKALEAVRNIIPQIEVDGGVAKFTKDVSSFVWSFALLKRLGAGNISSGAVADALQNPEEGNLATVAVEMGFDNDLLNYLNSKVGRDASAEKRLEARLKNTFEGIGIGAAVNSVMLGIKVLKRGGGKAVEMIQKQLSDSKLQQTSNSGIATAEPAGM